METDGNAVWPGGGTGDGGRQAEEEEMGAVEWTVPEEGCGLVWWQSPEASLEEGPLEGPVELQPPLSFE